MGNDVRVSCWPKFKGLLLDGGGAFLYNMHAVGFAYPVVIRKNAVDVVPLISYQPPLDYLPLPRLLFACVPGKNQAQEPMIRR